MIRLFLLYAILIFAKKAPKLIADLLKLDSKDGVGLKGLNIKNKMGEAALVGDKVKKGMTSIQGKTVGTIGGAAGGFLRAKGGLKARLMAGAAGASKGFAKGKHDAAEGKTKGIFSGAYKEMGNIASGGKSSIFAKPGELLNQFDDGLIKKVSSWAPKGEDGKRLKNKFSDPNAAENQAKLMKLKGDLTARFGAHKADQILERGLERLKGKFTDVDLSDEKQWMYLTQGKVWDDDKSKYVDSKEMDVNPFKGIKDAVDYSGAFDRYVFDGTIDANMNTAYRYSNIEANIEKKRAALDDAYQKYMSAKSSGLTADELTPYKEAWESAFSKYGDALFVAKEAKLIEVKVDGPKGSDGKYTSITSINGADINNFAANAGGVDSNLSKQVSELKKNTDSMMQKEEIKQQEAKASSSGEDKK